jgi:hypothetical protein
LSQFVALNEDLLVLWRERERERATMKVSEIPIKSATANKNKTGAQSSSENPHKPKPHFRPAQDDTKPVLQDPVLFLSLSISLEVHTFEACSFYFIRCFRFVGF